MSAENAFIILMHTYISIFFRSGAALNFLALCVIILLIAFFVTDSNVGKGHLKITIHNGSLNFYFISSFLKKMKNMNKYLLYCHRQPKNYFCVKIYLFVEKSRTFCNNCDSWINKTSYTIKINLEPSKCSIHAN